LRSLILYLLEYIEVSFRTHIAYYHAEKYGAVGYLNCGGFENLSYHNDFIEEFNGIISNDKRNNEIFTKHYRNNYNNKFPIWVTVELLSFGTLSRLYFNSEFEIKQKIAINNYGMKHDYIQNWLHGLVILRNICAHRGRLYNRPMPIH
jgi:abortive infection bacteriophage resistance protein